MIRRPPRSTQRRSSAASDVYKRQLLYKASQAGVKVDLIVRGTCCLRPGIPSISENISVKSILGRYLEHSRIYYFSHGGETKIYLGSADLMPRNLDRRVEVLFPVEDERVNKKICEEVIPAYLKDNAKAWIMKPDGTYERPKPKEGQDWFSAQEWFMKQRQHKS